MKDFKLWTRRILAFVFGGCGAGVLTYLSLQGNEAALGALIAVVSALSGFYFGARTGSEHPASS